MSVDHKRINGPSSVPYQVFIDSTKTPVDKDKKNSKKRSDNRRDDEVRKIFVKTGIVSQAKGSAYLEMGKTKVISSVYDPREIANRSNYSEQGQLFCKFKFASFSCPLRKSHQQDQQENEYSLIMQRALEPAVCREEFPNFQVDIYVIVLDNGGSALGAAIMAASLALANASVPMFGIVTAVTMGIHGKRNLMDPTAEEESLCLYPSKTDKVSMNNGIVMQAMLPQFDQISEFFFTGSLPFEQLSAIVQPLEKANSEIFPCLQLCLEKSVAKAVKKSNSKVEESVKDNEQ